MHEKYSHFDMSRSIRLVAHVYDSVEINTCHLLWQTARPPTKKWKHLPAQVWVRLGKVALSLFSHAFLSAGGCVAGTQQDSIDFLSDLGRALNSRGFGSFDNGLYHTRTYCVSWRDEETACKNAQCRYYRLWRRATQLAKPWVLNVVTSDAPPPLES